MLTPQQEELQIVDQLINNATYALNRASNIHGAADLDCLKSIANSLIAIAKLLQLQAEQN
jgi:hypothetical protein